MPTNTKQIQKQIDTNPDFVNLKRFDFSISKVLDRYPQGAPPKVIAQGLLMTEPEVEELFQSVILKLRGALKVEI